MFRSFNHLPWIGALLFVGAAAAQTATPMSTPCISPFVTGKAPVGAAPAVVAPCRPHQPPPPPPPPPPNYGYVTIPPKYYVISLVYAPPGASSSNGFTDGTSVGTTSTVSSNLSAGSTISFSATGGSLFGSSTLGTSFGVTNSSIDSTAFSDTYSSGQGAQLRGVNDQIDHSQDRFFIWLNPFVTIKQTAASTGYYTLSTPAGQPMDILDVSVAELRNPALIPASKLGSQNIHGTILPGLGVLNDADRATILGEDPLASGSNAACSSRYVYMESRPLEGPDYVGAGAVSNSFTESDAQQTTLTSGVTHTYTTGLSVGGSVGIFGFFNLGITQSETFSWGNTQSSGNIAGTSHQAAITLGSTTTGFLEWIDIYEDSEYHTFTFNPPPTSAGCSANATSNPPSAVAGPPSDAPPPVALKGVIFNTLGQRIAHQLVVVRLSDGTVRNIYTDQHGNYILYTGPVGPVDITAGKSVVMGSISSTGTAVMDVLVF